MAALSRTIPELSGMPKAAGGTTRSEMSNGARSSHACTGATGIPFLSDSTYHSTAVRCGRKT
eukprot:scaffold8047_cov417-Prasinococcus_capsulatus_cf.AAC.11